ncbi:MAG: aminopeptidase P family protein [Acidobacteria bacterium]|nr:aminopeptidase P family protein [Acidobacteriota bacterium]
MPHAPGSILERRHAAVRATLTERGLQAAIIVSLPNITWLTNFVGSSAVVVIDHERVTFITDSRYVTAVQDVQRGSGACPGFSLCVVEGSYDATLASVLASAGYTRVGYEAAHLTVARFHWLERTLANPGPVPTFVELGNGIEVARSVKDEYELATLRTAGQMLADVTRTVLGLPRAGMSERELALQIDVTIRRAGFEKPAFETIVASGPNAALPHARATDRTLGEGDLVVLDFGGVYDSYCVDLTRTVVVGPVSARTREVYEAVRRAHDAAVEATRPGASRFDIDAAARDVLAAAGMGAAFGHGTGHGLGLEVHEEPRISRRTAQVDASREAVAPGMVFTIEPGAYFPGWGGVRIEDDVLVTEFGVDVLTQVTTELIAV